MKKLITTCILVSLGISGWSQLVETPVKIIDNLPKAPTSLVNRSSTPVICGQDTAEYPRLKATGFVAIGFSGGNSVGQYFGAPQDIEVSGFTFYAWMSDPVRSLTPRVVCKLYKAGLDSLPTGLALRTDTMTIDSTFGTGLLSTLEKHASFDSAITLDYPYILVVENSDTANCSIVCNSYNAGDGDGENLNCATVSGLWFNGRNLNIGGTPFDADIQLYPHVKYSYKNDFTIKDQCYRTGDSIHFNNQYKKTVAGSKYYNRYIYYGYDRFCFRWYNDATSFSSYSSIEGEAKYAIHKNYNVRVISTLFHYRLGFGRCVDTTEKMLYYMPIAPIPAGDKTVCNGDSLGLLIKQNLNETYAWYNNRTDTVPEFTGRTYVQNPAIHSDTFYISSKNNNCESTRNYIPFEVNPYPTVDQIVNDSICAGANSNLEVKTSDGNVRWFTDSIGGSPIFTGKVYISGPYTRDTSFFVEVSNGTCALPGRQRISIFVSSNFAPLDPAVSNDTTLCLIDASALSLSASIASNDTIRWFNAPSGGNPLFKGTSYNYTPTAKEVKTFYVDAWNGVCGSSRVPIKLTINDYPKPKSITDAEVCKGQDTFLSSTVDYGLQYWYKDTLLSPVALGTKNNILNAQSTDTFYIQTRDQGCISPIFTPVELRVNEAPLVSNLSNPSICAENKATVSLDLNQGEIKWYEDSTSNTIHTGSPFVTPVLYGGKTYFYQTNFKGCRSHFTAVNVPVNSKPAAGFTYSVKDKEVEFEGLLGSIYSYQWSFGDGNTGTEREVTHTYAANAIYQVRLIVVDFNGCSDTSIVEVNIGRISIDRINSFNVELYPNPATGNQSIQLTSDLPIHEVSIVDIQGKKVYYQLFHQKSSSALKHGLKQGAYFVIIKDSKNRMVIKKILIE